MNDDKKLDLIGYGIYIGSRWSKQNTIDELEKIKEEIAESFSSSVSDCIYIIDKRISELKGDINETHN